ncbi:MAG: hypothetical protein C4320_02865 [Armatimonadota bacterium]
MASKRKPKRGLILAGIGVLLLLAGGGGFAAWKFLGQKGPVAKAAPAKLLVAQVTKITPPPIKTTPIKPKLKPVPRSDPEAGAGKLAKLWNEVETPRLLAMTAPWKVAELAPVTLKMDPAKVAEMLGQLPSKRASDLSREMRRLAALPDPE